MQLNIHDVGRPFPTRVHLPFVRESQLGAPQVAAKRHETRSSTLSPKTGFVEENIGAGEVAPIFLVLNFWTLLLPTFTLCPFARHVLGGNSQNDRDAPKPVLGLPRFRLQFGSEKSNET